MSESRGFGTGDERLGRVLRDAVEGRGRPVTASLAGAGIGHRTFVAGVERCREQQRPSGERPRFGAIAIAAVACAIGAIAIALWPAITAHRAPAAAPRTVPVAAEQHDAGQAAAAPAATDQPAPPSPPAPADQAPAGAVAPATAWAPAPPSTGASQPPAAARQPATPAPAPSPKPAASAPPAPPALTFANHEVVGCCLALGGRWHDLARGGPPSAWTANRAATATWNLGSPSGGLRWDSVRVRVWIPDSHAGAVVRLTVTATSGAARSVSAFDVVEHGHPGWLTIPGTFSAGTPTQRTGSVTVRMSFVRPFASHACRGGACVDMAAGPAMFEWS